ncbi:ArsR/SmtB family transcription factor [Streptomyces spiralis]|uniref:ArsR/SmtB family transcription factor n=1 Tax=Streptomyces spiralis TaxID=66376 RepID=UPI00368E4C1C
MPDVDGHPAIHEMDIGSIFAALADPHRRRVVEQLCAEADSVERTCASFGLKVGKSTLTHHFRVLREAGLTRQIDYGNSRKVTLRRRELDDRFPGLLRLVSTQAVEQSSTETPRR